MDMFSGDKGDTLVVWVSILIAVFILCGGLS